MLPLSQCTAPTNCATPAANLCDGCTTCNDGYSLNTNTKACDACTGGQAADKCASYTANSCTCLTCKDTTNYEVVSGACVLVSPLGLAVWTGLGRAGQAAHVLRSGRPVVLLHASRCFSSCSTRCRLRNLCIPCSPPTENHHPLHRYRRQPRFPGGY